MLLTNGARLTIKSCIFYFFQQSSDVDRHLEGRVYVAASAAFMAMNAMLYLLDSFRYSFFFNRTVLILLKCKSILPSFLFALVRARVNHGKQTSLFHNVAVKKEQRSNDTSDTVLVPNQCLCLKLWLLE